VQGDSDPQRFIGKTGPGFEGCNVPLNGREIVVTNSFLILVSPLPGQLNELPPAAWTAASNGVVPGRMIQTFGGDHLCRAMYQQGLHPGKVIRDRGCAIPYGRNEIVVPTYEVLTRPVQ
jgi:hypothetical protein